MDALPNSAGRTDTTLFAEFADTTDRILKKDSGMRQKIVAFAKTLQGVPYKYCSMDPDGGFDCSGFVNYVFNHFSIHVPRSSVEFTDIGQPIPLDQARPGDLILFTGTNSGIRTVGHIGIITTNDNGDVSFIQATSGAAYSVVVSPLDPYYMTRFVKVIRLLD